MVDSPSASPPAKKTPPARLPHATLKHPTIEAIIGRHFRFATRKQARDRLKAVRESFTVTKLSTDVKPDADALQLWIRGYSVTPELKNDGYLGNFARFSVAKTEDGKWTLEAAVLNIDKKFHPQRRQSTQKFPNWGHPILRDTQKGRIYKTPELAQAELRRLHEAFPEVSIPLTGKLYLMIYRKAAKETASNVEKWVLTIVMAENGESTIAIAPNTHRADKAAQVSTISSSAPEVQGKFSAQVLLRRSRKRPKPTRKTPPESNA